ncbi:Cellulose synthase-like protein H1 [Heracleum sosnowskyi]|uniref:Cellulose synthase-like protein H1 n=1 Tax=Heracleum sosnowskyi TaxID=360622 RepID=A0AAD8LY78_9APIA|nr:Cellulose synthase-like protein H1 [Heracleum sosnowskyi]
MANKSSQPLYERIHVKNSIPRAVELLILFLLFLLLAYHLISLKNHGIPSLFAFLCESCFTFSWILVINCKWNQVRYIQYPDRLPELVSELPAVDMFVTTADAELEPPILTMNTVLSLLAVDYPPQKLSCYLSDDGASPLTYYSLVETSKFAGIWVPFCKKYEISIRAPFRYFTSCSKPSKDDPFEFQQEWKTVKDKYDMLCQKIEDASQTYVPSEVFSKVDKKNHPPILKVVVDEEEGLPHLVYISREKRPKHPHNFKAGAMNVLTRVSGLMTNAPFILNVDCDMHVNNPQVILHAMCMFFGVENEKDCGFVQFPQHFYDGLNDDPFGNQMVVLFKYLAQGLAGIQGPVYAGTNCFHRRKVIYGLSPVHKALSGKLTDEDLERRFGKLNEFKESAVQILSASPHSQNQGGLISSLDAANLVAGCAYEHGTCWGTEVGWKYGSATEDILTGLGIQEKGWRSIFCTPEPPAFLGCAPSCGPSTMIQTKRWATGLLEILFSFKSPIISTIYGNLQFRQCLAYMWILIWGLRSIPELVYALLPAYCIISRSHFLPKVNEPAILVPVTIFVIYNLYTLSEYLRVGLSSRAWWNNQRMARINCTSSWLFACFSIILKLIGLSETVFEVTQKNQATDDDGDDQKNINSGKFTFNESPIFIPGTTILLVNLTALAVGVVGFRHNNFDESEVGVAEMICCLCVVLYFSIFFKGLFGKGKYGIPSATIFKSGVLALGFTHFCKWSVQA